MTQYLRNIRILPRGVRYFLYSEGLFGMAVGLYALLYNLHLLSLGFNETQIGQLTSISTLVMAGAAIPLALLADRFGRKRVLIAGLLLHSAGFYAVAFGELYSHFVAAQILSALGMSMVVTVEFPLLFGYCQTRQQQTLSYSLVFAIFTLFNGAGTLLGGFLPDWLPQGKTIYQSSLIVMAVIATLTGVTRMFLPAPQPVPKPLKQADIDVRFRLGSRRPSKPVLIYVGCSFLLGIAFALTVPFFNIIIKFRLDWMDEWVGTLLTLNGVVLFFCSLFTPYLLEKWGVKWTAISVLLIPGMLSLALAVHLPVSLFIVFFLIRNGVFVTLSNVIEGQAMQATPDEERSMLGGLRSVGRNIGSTMGAYAAGIILAAKNYTLPFLITGIVILFTLIYFRSLMLPLLQANEEDKALTDTASSSADR